MYVNLEPQIITFHGNLEPQMILRDYDFQNVCQLRTTIDIRTNNLKFYVNLEPQMISRDYYFKNICQLGTTIDIRINHLKIKNTNKLTGVVRWQLILKLLVGENFSSAKTYAIQ